jgi:hypothetical protein
MTLVPATYYVGQASPITPEEVRMRQCAVWLTDTSVRSPISLELP